METRSQTDARTNEFMSSVMDPNYINRMPPHRTDGKPLTINDPERMRNLFAKQYYVHPAYSGQAHTNNGGSRKRRNGTKRRAARKGKRKSNRNKK